MAESRGSPPRPTRIEALSRLDDLEAIADEFVKKAGYEPELLSHWDPKLEFQMEIEGWLTRGDINPSPVPYTYSSYLDLNTRALKSKLHEDEGRRLIVTSSGTASIATIITFMRSLGVEAMHVVTPAYFAIEALCGNLGMSVSYTPVHRSAGRYHLPTLPDVATAAAVWLTMPIFGTSCYVDAAEVGGWIDTLPSDTMVIVDESLAYVDRGCLTATKSLDRVVRISTPNKALCINGEKASFVSAAASFIDGLNDWSECLAGGIGASGLHALRFFQSRAFDAAIVHSRKLQTASAARLDTVLLGLGAWERDKETDGHFVMLYWPSIPMARLHERDLLMRFMTETGASIIPASRNRHPDAYGLSFRVNLLRLDNAGLGALRRLALFFEAIAP